MKVLFLGTPHFSTLVLKQVLLSHHQVVAVVTSVDRPSGRGHKTVPSELKKFALQHNIPVLQFEKINQNIDEIKKIDYDVALTAAFGQILGEQFLSHRLCLNVHPSLLPKYRGATPIQTALLNGDKLSGVTIMKMARAVDSGDILMQQEATIYDDDNTDTLMERFGTLGGVVAVLALNALEEGKATFTPQDEGQATFTKMLTKQDALLDFGQTANGLVCKVRAMSEIGAYFVYNGQNFKVGELADVSEEFSKSNSTKLKQNMVENRENSTKNDQNIDKNDQKTTKDDQKCLENDQNIGKILCSKKRLVVGCKGGAVEILLIQAPSRKMMRSSDFLSGFRFEENVCLKI